MKYKEKEKLWIGNIKEFSKKDNWKFKSHFIFKKIDDFFYSSTFSVHVHENIISGWLGYKAYNIDNVFWDIINEIPNKTSPLSFRAEAAFCVQSLNLYEFKIKIIDERNPEKEIIELLKKIDESVVENFKKTQTITSFFNELMKDEKKNSVGIITSLIEQKLIEEALIKIEEYKSKEYRSGFGFGSKDFYDLAKEYCLRANETKTNKRSDNSKCQMDSEFNDVYDKAKWHIGGDFPKGLKVSQAYIHTGFFITWLIDNDLFLSEDDTSNNELLKVKDRKMSGAKFFENYLDGVLTVNDMNEMGNKFAREYYEKGHFFKDYTNIFGDKHLSLYHVEDNWENYKLVNSIISKRFQDWLKPKKNKWWKIF